MFQIDEADDFGKESEGSVFKESAFGSLFNHVDGRFLEALAYKPDYSCEKSLNAQLPTMSIGTCDVP